MSNYVFPVGGYSGQIQDHWGSVKGGSDLMAPRGSPIYNMQAGRVIESGWNSVGGNSMLVQGDDGLQYYYAHFDSPSAVKVGQYIPEGTYIAPVGNTGDASGGPTHLHIGIGPDIKLGADKYGGTGGDYDAISLLNAAYNGQQPAQQGPQKQSTRVNAQDTNAVAQYIRYAAAKRGIDPEVAVKVANSEGLNSYVGDNNSSFGPFQLHYGGVAAGGNSVSGLGDTFTRQTGLDARDPNTIQQQIDFALDNAKTGGWGAWHGAARVGLNPYDGIGLFTGDPEQYNTGFDTSPTTGYPQQNQPQKQQRPAGMPDWVPDSMAHWFQPGAFGNVNQYQSASPFAMPQQQQSYSNPFADAFSAFTQMPQRQQQPIYNAMPMPFNIGSGAPQFENMPYTPSNQQFQMTPMNYQPSNPPQTARNPISLFSNIFTGKG